MDASTALLERAASWDSERSALLSTAVDQPVVMRWDVVADSIVRNELADIVPPDADHQQAARAHLTLYRPRLTGPLPLAQAVEH